MRTADSTKPAGIRTRAEADPSFLSHLLSVAKSTRSLVGIKLSDIDVVVGQDQFLLLLADLKTAAVNDLAARLSVRPSTVSKMADILRRKGWIERSPDPADARRVLVRLTEAGRAAAERVRAVEAALETELLSALHSEEAILRVLAQLDTVLARRLSRLR